jgi:hypothetical protein
MKERGTYLFESLSLFLYEPIREKDPCHVLDAAMLFLRSFHILGVFHMSSSILCKKEMCDKMKVQRVVVYVPFKERQRRDQEQGQQCVQDRADRQADGADAHKQYTFVREDMLYPFQSLNDH